jgi:hypothetical protein
MRKLAALAVLALSLLTVACTESEDVGTGDEAASIDDVDQLALDDEAGSLTERGVPSDGAADTAGTISKKGGVYVPPPRPRNVMDDIADPISDTIGETGVFVPPPRGQAGEATGVAECPPVKSLDSGEPIVGAVSSAELGRRAQIRFEQIAKIKGKAPAIRLERIGATTKR